MTKWIHTQKQKLIQAARERFYHGLTIWQLHQSDIMSRLPQPWNNYAHASKIWYWYPSQDKCIKFHSIDWYDEYQDLDPVAIELITTE